MISALLLVGILTALAGMGMVTAMQGYLFSKDNAGVSEKTQLALTRINRELLECYNCKGVIGNPVAMPFTNTLGQRSIRLTGGNIVISDGVDTDILLDKVLTFGLTYNSDGSISAKILLSTRPGGVRVSKFITTVFPRNTP